MWFLRRKNFEHQADERALLERYHHNSQRLWTVDMVLRRI